MNEVIQAITDLILIIAMVVLIISMFEFKLIIERNGKKIKITHKLSKSKKGKK